MSDDLEKSKFVAGRKVKLVYSEPVYLDFTYYFLFLIILGLPTFKNIFLPACHILSIKSFNVV